MVRTWLRFEWIVAIRFLRKGRLQTLFIVCGVALGVAGMVFMSALKTGRHKIVQGSAEPQGGEVLGGTELAAGPDRVVGARVLATAAEVVDAIHDGAEVVAVFPSQSPRPERAFVVIEHEDGRECIAFDGAPLPGRNVTDMDGLDD